MITTYLAEDQSMLNSALATLLDLEDDIEIVGTAQDGKTALADILLKQPNVAILDIEMPGLTGLEVAAQIHTLTLPTKVIILTTFAREIYFQKAVAAQVNGYLLKDSPSDELVKTIRAVMQGKTIYDPELVKNVLRQDHNPLTPKEINILQIADTGKSTKEIASELFLSDGTVRNYMSAIFSKLGVHNRVEALNVARKNQWLETK